MLMLRPCTIQEKVTKVIVATKISSEAKRGCQYCEDSINAKNDHWLPESLFGTSK